MGHPGNPTMTIAAIILYLLLLSHQTVSEEEQVQRYVLGEKGENTTLQCLDQPVNMSSVLYRWKKDGAVVVATPNHSNPSEHLSILNNGSLRISGLLYIDAGLYTCDCECQMKNGSLWQTHSNIQLQIADAPERHPECSWEVGNEPSDVLFICTWYGGYPVPTLYWQEVYEKSVIAKGPTINSTHQETERLEIHVNRHILHDKEKVKCTGHHVTGVEKSCSFNLEIPYPLGDPLVTALEGSNLTLSCSETNALPPAKTVWKKMDDVINTTMKYIVSNNGPIYKLTIINVTMDDAGIYYCYSENPLGARELEVILNVKVSAGNGGAVVGVFVSLLIMMIGIVVSVTLYSKRDRICIGLGFSHLDDDRGDILSLVDSDEEEIFSDSVPQLPPLTNGHATTLVEIHRIPSIDHDENADSTEHTGQDHPDQTEAAH